MTPSELELQLSCYHTNPGDLVVLVVNSTPEHAMQVGAVLNEWAIARAVKLLVLAGSPTAFRLDVQSDADLAVLGLRRIEAGDQVAGCRCVVCRNHVALAEKLGFCTKPDGLTKPNGFASEDGRP